MTSSTTARGISLAVVLTVLLVTAAATTHYASAAKPTAPGSDKPGKQLKCNNIKIMAIVTGINTKNGTVYITGGATLQDQTVRKSISVNASEPSESDGVGLPLFFKKAFQPCPGLGTPFSVSVNGQSASGVLQSLTKPNIVEVDISGAQTTISIPSGSGTLGQE